MPNPAHGVGGASAYIINIPLIVGVCTPYGSLDNAEPRSQSQTEKPECRIPVTFISDSSRHLERLWLVLQPGRRHHGRITAKAVYYVEFALVKVAMRKHLLGTFLCALCIAFHPGMPTGCS